MEHLLMIVEFFLKLDVLIIVSKLVIYVPILYRFFSNNYGETFGTFIGYEKRKKHDRYYYDFSLKQYVLRKERYMYSSIVDYTVDGKKYQNIEQLSHSPYVFKKVGSRIKIIYMKDNPVDSSIKYNLIFETIIFCVLGLVYMLLRWLK